LQNEVIKVLKETYIGEFLYNFRKCTMTENLEALEEKKNDKGEDKNQISAWHQTK
jgi:hypothetical protein